MADPRPNEESASARPQPHPLGDAALRRLLRNLPGMAYRCRFDTDWTMEYVSHGCRDLTGFDPVDLVDSRVVSFARLIHPEDRERVEETVRRAVVAAVPFRITYRLVRADGRQRWVWEQGVGVAGPLGEPETVEGFITDVTERVELAAKADDMSRLYRAVADQALTGVFVLRGGRFLYCNPRLTELLGLPSAAPEDLPSLLALVVESDRERVSATIEALERQTSDVARVELAAVRTDGDPVDLEVQINGIDLEDGTALVGVALDVTARRRAERRYHQTQKMEQLGRLAAGVAHDFNNVLSVIRASTDLILLEPSLSDPVAEDVRTIAEAAERGAGLSRQLMAFGRARPSEAILLSAHRVVESVHEILDRISGRDIDLRVEAAPGVGRIDLDPTHLEHVIMNLVINAKDAMPEGGAITLRIRQEPVGPPECPAETRDRPHLVVEVEDTGTGVPPELLPRLFEPYFTTKGDQGIGLGLGNVWRIASDAGGWVGVDSEVGRGSTFRVYFPVADGE
jgi:PAS domain S-box-containing protein